MVEGRAGLYGVLFGCVLTALPTIASASLVDGVRLNNLWPDFVKAVNKDPSTDYVSATDFRSYVDGVVDALNGIKFCTPDNGTSGQFSTIVGKYLQDHPEEWTEPGPEIVSRALSKPFPCE